MAGDSPDVTSMQVTEMLDLEGRCMNDLFSFFLTSRGIRRSSKSGKSERERGRDRD